MKNLIVSALIAASLIPAVSYAANPAITLSDAEIAAKVAQMVQQASGTAGGTLTPVLTGSMRSESQIQDVMKMNGITREEAIIRIHRSESSQKGFVPKPIISVFSAYNPASNAFQQPAMNNFYAGLNKETKQEVFTLDKRLEVLPSFWYCNPGVRLIYSSNASSCEDV